MHKRLLNVLCGTLVLSAGLWAADPLVGTWKLNLEKSKFGSRPAPKSSTVTWTAQDGGIFHYTAKGVGPDGQPTLAEITCKFDGKEYKITGSPLADTVSFKRPDPQHIESIGKKDGKVVVTIKGSISKDGKTQTTVWTGSDASGKPQTWTTVSDKQ
jgi:hypothetical protein